LNADQLAALGAFLSGMGSVLSAAWYVRRQKKKADEDCLRRLQEHDEALREGIEIGRWRDENRRAS